MAFTLRKRKHHCLTETVQSNLGGFVGVQTHHGGSQ